MLHHLETVVDTPWILVVVFAVAGLDALLPFMPSETTVLAVAVGAATVGHPNLVALIAVAAVGAFVGDQVAYRLGRRSDARITARLDRHHRGRTARNWVARQLAGHGGLVIVFGRYLPGGRSVTAFTAGLVGYPAVRFGGYTALAVLLWSTQAALLGHFGGVAFADHPEIGVAVATVTALLAAVLASAVHRAVIRREATPGAVVSG